MQLFKFSTARWIPSWFCALWIILMAVSPVHGQRLFTGSDGVEAAINPAHLKRIVSIGSAVTETIYALGAGDQVIATDESSVYPAAVFQLPRVSYTRSLSPEGILSVSPGIILASNMAGPETAVQQIRSTGIPFLKVSADETVDGGFERTRQLGRILQREQEADVIIARMQQQLDHAGQIRSGLDGLPKVLFIYARGVNTIMGAGDKTSAKTVIGLAGGVNAFSGFEGYKPLTAEAVVAANPDVILMMDEGMRSLGGLEGLMQIPGVSLTSAAKNNRIYAMDGNYLLGFGPRMGQAILELMKHLHPEADITLSAW